MPPTSPAPRTLKRLAADSSDAAAEQRRQVARALGLVTNPRLRPLLVPLIATITTTWRERR